MKQIEKLYNNESVTVSDIEAIFNEIIKGELSDIVISSVLTALIIRGEGGVEISGVAKSLINNASPFARPNYEFGDIVGTGGDNYNTINVSTISAIVATASGLKICKHGNRKVTSKSGSADVLAELGIDLNASAEKSRIILDKAGLCFLMAPNYHTGIKYVMPVRIELKRKTVFNIVGPIINPARPDFILNGVFSKHLLEPVANAHMELGLKKGAIVYGDGLDEVCLHGVNNIVEICKDKKIIRYDLSHTDFGLKPQSIESIKGGDPSDNAKIVIDVLKGQGKIEFENIVAANVALLLRIAGTEGDLKKGVDIAKQAMHNGSALSVLELIKG